MRDPVFPTTSAGVVTIATGNQFQGAGNAGNQLQNGSTLLFKRTTDTNWTPVPLLFATTIGNNKYYTAGLPTAGFVAGTTVEYYLRIAYDDHDTTFLQRSADGTTSVATGDEAAARATAFTFTIETPAVRGEWGPVFGLQNVGIHAHLLPTGEVLMWGRRNGSDPNESLDEHFCTPFIWNPATGQTRDTQQQPKMQDGTTVNLFCSGHTFLPDGRLLVAGGHFLDAQGLNQAAIYDAAADTWTATAVMRQGRWYPTATTLPDGTVLVLSGSVTPGVANFTPEVWSNGAWIQIAGFPDPQNLDQHNAAAFPLFPRVHVASDGRVFMSGSEAMSWFVDVSGGGKWTLGPTRDNAQRDYAPSVMYDADKILYIGGGNDLGTQAPTANAEVIDLGAAAPKWTATDAMHFPRRQHNATILPDGTVLVTGGTRGGGGPNGGFNDLTLGQPVHVAELWDPSTGHWTQLAAEAIDRCYHSTSVLLPDATVLSAGGGEYRPTSGANAPPNDPQDTHRDAQIFTPPYLFNGDQPAPRPQITAAPDTISYGATFDVSTPQANQIERVSLIRLSSVTHAFNMGQHIHFMTPQLDGANLKLTAPASPNLCPPGHYLLFILDNHGVPSIAKIVQLTAAAAAPEVAALIGDEVLSASLEASQATHFPDALERRNAVIQAAHGPAVVLGITGTCPYGIGACWGGAHEALLTLDGVQAVDPIPNPDDSTARVFLKDARLPSLHRWREAFYRLVNGSYALRGVEVSLQGRIEQLDGRLVLDDTSNGSTVELSPLIATDKVQWDAATGAPEPAESYELAAYERLATEARERADQQQVTVTGPLEQADGSYRLEVRLFAWQ
jgi:galactose oxidase